MLHGGVPQCITLPQVLDCTATFELRIETSLYKVKGTKPRARVMAEQGGKEGEVQSMQVRVICTAKGSALKNGRNIICG